VMIPDSLDVVTRATNLQRDTVPYMVVFWFHCNIVSKFRQRRCWGGNLQSSSLLMSWEISSLHG
jgi:hypothetical protein